MESDEDTPTEPTDAEGAVFNDADFPDQRIPAERAEYVERLTELYIYYAGTTAHISDLRMQGSSLCTAICGALLAAVAAMLYLGNHVFAGPGIALVSLVGLPVTWSWRRMIQHYRDLNSAKFEVIAELEKRLPARPLVSAEWPRFRAHRQKRGGRFRALTELEDSLILVVRLLFFVSILSGLLITVLRA